MTTTPDTIAANASATYRFALAAAEMAANTRAQDVVLLDLRERSPVTEFFILATGSSPRQMRTVAEEIQELGKRMGFKAWHTTGFESAKWILVDCVSVVAHVFDADSRDFYDLELLWGDCPRIDWRKELGLPPVAEGSGRVRTRIHFGGDSAGLEDIEAEEEQARLEGDDEEEEEGDVDMDEDADVDAPIVMEFPDESTGSNSVEFVEVDPPTKRRKRGRSIYPTVIEEEDTTEEERGMNRVADLGGRSQSTDEDDRERAAEAKADEDVEAVSREDLPRSRIKSRPMGGVNAGMSSMGMLDDEEEDQEGDFDAADREQDHRDQIPEAHEAAAETIERSREGRKIKSRRKDERGPKAAAPGRVNVKRAKAGVVKKAAAKKAPKKKPAAKRKAAKKAPGKKPPAKKPAPKKVAAKKTTAKKKPASRKK